MSTTKILLDVVTKVAKAYVRERGFAGVASDAKSVGKAAKKAFNKSGGKRS